jgi:hypothetical protein
MSGDLIAVLLASNGIELTQFLSLDEYMVDIPLILILPDQGRETVSTGHRLRPRFISFLHSDFTDVSAVLAKMLERTETLRMAEEGGHERVGSKEYGAGRGSRRNRGQAVRIGVGEIERA